MDHLIDIMYNTLAGATNISPLPLVSEGQGS